MTTRTISFILDFLKSSWFEVFSIENFFGVHVATYAATGPWSWRHAVFLMILNAPFSTVSEPILIILKLWIPPKMYLFDAQLFWGSRCYKSPRSKDQSRCYKTFFDRSDLRPDFIYEPGQNFGSRGFVAACLLPGEQGCENIFWMDQNFWKNANPCVLPSYISTLRSGRPKMVL